MKGAGYYQEYVRVPAPSAINGSYSNLKVATMLSIFGSPRTRLTDDCMPATNHKLLAALERTNVGPFMNYGLRLLNRKLAAIFAEIRIADPELYGLIRSEGCLCVRRVRGSQSTPSSHAFGAAIDLNIGGQLDDVGDGMCQRGMLQMYGNFHRHGMYWAAEFKGGREDSMHWEVADEEMRLQHAKGAV
jgi:hypothetical protein